MGKTDKTLIALSHTRRDVFRDCLLIPYLHLVTKIDCLSNESAAPKSVAEFVIAVFAS